MKLFNFFTEFFNQKSEYIGLTSFRDTDSHKVKIRKDKQIVPEKTTLTGLLKRV